MRMRHEEALRDYGKAKANIDGSGNVLCYFCGSIRAAGPEAATAERTAAEGECRGAEESATSEE